MKSNSTYFVIIALLIAIISSDWAIASGKYNKRLPRFLNASTPYRQRISDNGNLMPNPNQDVLYEKTEATQSVIHGDGGIVIKKVSNMPTSQTETWIAIDPNNPDRMIAGSNDMGYWDSQNWRMGIYYTLDGGDTWKETSTPPLRPDWLTPPVQGFPIYSIFDPGLAFDADGNMYYGFNAAVGLSPDSLGHADGGVFMAKSTNNGASWDAFNNNVIDVVYEGGAGQPRQPFHDKVLIAADANKNSPFKNNVYASWMSFNGNNSTLFGIAFSRSTNGGNNWSTYRIVPGGGRNPLFSYQSPQPIVGPKGEIYILWRAGTDIETSAFLNKSTDGGETWAWQSPKNCQTVRSQGFINTLTGRRTLVDKQSMRVSSYAVGAADFTNDNFYVAQTGVINGENGLYFSKSSDGGNTWLESNQLKRIDDNDLNNDVFFPAMACDPVTGLIAVAYYSSQNDPDNVGVDLYLAVSQDQGESWSNVRVTPQTWFLANSNSVFKSGGEEGNLYWGDYIGISVVNNTVYPCFYMPATPNGNFFSNSCYVAEVGTGPVPPTNLKALNDYTAPTKVVLTWKDPVKNSLGGDLGDFEIIIYRGETEIGKVAKSVLTFTDNNAIDGEQFTYNLATRTTDGKESGFVSVSGIAGGALKPQSVQVLSSRPASNGFVINWTTPEFHVDNSFFHDAYKLNVYNSVDDQLLGSVNTDNLQAGESYSSLLEISTEQFYQIYVKVVGKRGVKETESEKSENILAYAGEPYSTFLENFDDDQNKIPTISLAESNPWAATDAASVSPPYSLTESPDGNYPSRANLQLVFAPAIVGQEKQTLSFEHIANIDPGDQGTIDVSNDFGLTWTNLVWVNTNRSPEDFTGDLATSKFKTEGRSLADFVGDTILIRLGLSSNAFRENDGWYIDNLRIDDNPNSVEYDMNLSESISLSSYPNPAENTAYISIHSAVLSGSANLEVFNALGNKVLNIDNLILNIGSNELPLNVKSLANGFYYVRLTTNEVTKTTVVVVSR